jgi:hypothetical protein
MDERGKWQIATWMCGPDVRAAAAWKYPKTRKRLTLFGPCLVSKKFCKIFQISRHIKSLDVYMKY